MNKLNRFFTKRFATLGVMGLMALAALIPTTVFADATPTPAAKCGALDVKCVIAIGDERITSRQNALNTLNTKVTNSLNDKRITSDQASALQSDISTNQSGLSSLKTKLDADTKPADVRQDFSNIYVQFRIFAVVIPRDARTLEYDVELNVQTKMQAAIPTIQTAISAASASDKDKLNSLFSDYKTQVAAAGSAISPLPGDFSAMTPDAFNQTRTAYESTRKAVDDAEKTARGDLKQAANDLKQMTAIVGKIK